MKIYTKERAENKVKLKKKLTENKLRRRGLIRRSIEIITENMELEKMTGDIS